MKHNLLIFIVLVLVLLAGFAGYHIDNTRIPNRLTSFIDPATVNLEPASYKISNPSGNILRDAVRVLEKDSRTKGEFDRLSLMERALAGEISTFHFIAHGKDRYMGTATPVSKFITIKIKEDPKGPYYQLSMDSNP